VKTYCLNQVEKPLKVCVHCKRAMYMHADVCTHCRDPYAERRAKRDVRDISGNVMHEP
jgi:predicted amidophosphoribosyltransferase